MVQFKNLNEQIVLFNLDKNTGILDLKEKVPLFRKPFIVEAIKSLMDRGIISIVNKTLEIEENYFKLIQILKNGEYESVMTLISLYPKFEKQIYGLCLKDNIQYGK